MHVAVDTLGNLLALLVTPANAQERTQARKLARQVQAATQRSVKLAYVDQGYTGEKPAAQAEAQGIELEVLNSPRPSAASCCCRAAGWSSVPSRGWRVSVAFLVTTNGSLPLWRVYIGWLLRACCSATCSRR